MEGHAEFVIIALEAQSLSKLAILIFEFRCGLFQLADAVQYLVNFLFLLPILQPLPKS